MVLEQECLAKCQDLTISTPCLEDCFRAGGWVEVVQESSLTATLPEWVVIALAGVLVILSGLFSGLTLGLLSLDLVGLRILEQGGDECERKYAAKIIPVRRHGNLLLCTLLFGNVVVNSAISILLSDLTSGAVGLVTSTVIILIVGEIIPQSVCSRHGLMIGAHSLWLVKIFMFVFLPVSWPISKLLDWVLGRDIGMVYSREELKRLIDLHYEDPEAQKESHLTFEDHKLLIGSLEYKAKRVVDVMTCLENCFMLEKSTRLDFKVLTEIYKSGYSRIPVFVGNRHNISGVLYVKDLILVDPDDEVELGTIMGLRGHGVERVYDDVTLDKVLKTFMTTYNHLLVVYKRGADLLDSENDVQPIGNTAVMGLITLEDVIEEVLQDEIVDETDKIQDPIKPFRVFDNMSTFLKFFDHKMHGSKLSDQELRAVCAFLVSNLQEFACFKDNESHLEKVVRRAEIIEVDGPAKGDDIIDTAFLDQFEQCHDSLVLYRNRVPAQHFTLVLQGKALIRSGNEGFTLEVGPWCHLGRGALSMLSFIPDFDAIGDSPCRFLRIHKSQYTAAVDAVNGCALMGNVLLSPVSPPSDGSVPYRENNNSSSKPHTNTRKNPFCSTRHGESLPEVTPTTSRTPLLGPPHQHTTQVEMSTSSPFSDVVTDFM
ncbi:hypothetical protein BSKO_03346 [Bryopsis sp. KO-2023]|nr:hypothetical protein BSKO_03346 [Bryopsis sp. KO-2023]